MPDDDLDSLRKSLIGEITIQNLKAKRELLKTIESKAAGALSSEQLAFVAYAYALAQGAQPGVLPGAAPPHKKQA